MGRLLRRAKGSAPKRAWRQGLRCELQGLLLNDDGHLSTFSIWTYFVLKSCQKLTLVWLQDVKMTKWFVVPWSDLEAAVGQLPELNAVEPHRYLTPANIPAVYFLGSEKSFTPPEGFPKRISSGHR